MAFTRDDLAAYEQQPQTATPDPIVTAPAATEPEPAQAEPAATEESSASVETDQPDAGDATSDEDDAGSSTAAADAEGESEEGETEGDSAPEGEQESTTQTAKPQSRAFKRIQELNSKMLEERDLAEGYKEFGKLTLEQLKAAQAEIERLKAGGKPAASATEAAAAVADKLGPMPKLTDPEINFDPDLLAEKTAEWTKKAIKLGVQETLQQVTQETTQKSEAQKVAETFQSRIADFKKTHTDWDTKVKNPELPKLHPAAQAVIMKSELGAAVVYELGSNVPEAKRIAALAPEDQVAEIGAMRAELARKAKAADPAPAGGSPAPKGAPAAGAKPAKKSVSQAPPPPTPVPAGKRSQERDATDPSMGMDEFARQHRASKQNARLAARKLRGLS